MVTLCQIGSGSSECQIIKPAASPEKWPKLLGNAIRLLEVQQNNEAAEILRTGDFVLYEATNGFGDEFFALAKKAKHDAYVDYGIEAGDSNSRFKYRNIAWAFEHVGFFIRFVVVELDTDASVEPVDVTATVAPVDVVKRALRDAEQLLATSGAISAIDRVHTALHGYLKWVCEQAGSTPATNPTSRIRPS